MALDLSQCLHLLPTPGCCFTLLASACPLPLAKDSLPPDTHQFILSFILYFTFVQNVRLTLISASTPYFAFFDTACLFILCVVGLSLALCESISWGQESLCVSFLYPWHRRLGLGLHLAMSKSWGRKERNREGGREKGREEGVIQRGPVQWEGRGMYLSRHRCTQDSAESYILLCLLISKPHRCTQAEH